MSIEVIIKFTANLTNVEIKDVQSGNTLVSSTNVNTGDSKSIEPDDTEGEAVVSIVAEDSGNNALTDRPTLKDRQTYHFPRLVSSLLDEISQIPDLATLGKQIEATLVKKQPETRSSSSRSNKDN